LSEAEMERREKDGHNQYFINMLDGSTMDSRLVDCFAKYANDAKGAGQSAFKNNAKITLDEEKKVCLMAIRKIKVGEEIFCSYGKRYWSSK